MKKSKTTKNNYPFLSFEEKQKTKKSFIDKVAIPRNSLRFNSDKIIQPVSIESFDIETIGRRNDFYLFGYIDKYDIYHYSFDKAESIKMLSKQKHRGVVCYATNLSFDFNSLSEGTDLKNKCEFVIRGNNYIIVKWKGTYNEIKLMDSVNYGGLSVESMGKILKLPKGKKPKCLGKKPKNKKELDELIAYNKRDCEITKAFMELLQKTLNLLGGELKSTISSCAMDLFRRKFLDTDVIQENFYLKGIDYKDKLFKAYYGGRCEVFSRGLIKNYNYYDVNSLYPSVMLESFPVPMSVGYKKGEDRGFLKYEGVSYFELITPYTKYPLLPVRIKGKLCFPYGYIKGYYTHLEIRKQLEYFPETKILLMNDTLYYTQVHKYFKNYVETLYNLRQEYKSKNSEMEVVCKLLLNSLYGRFALRTVDKTMFINFDNYEEAKAKILECEQRNIKVRCNSVNEGYYSESETFEGITSYPIWSIYTTAYARLKLYEYIRKLNPVYVDTDSCITKETIPDSKILGEMKLEKKIKEGLIIKPKLYFLDDEIKSKGVPIPKDIKHKLRLKNNILEKKPLHYDKFVKIKEGIGRNIKVNSIIVQTKSINLEDSKRDWKNQEFNKKELQNSEPIKLSKEDYEE